MPHTAKKMPISTSLFAVGALVFAATCYGTALAPHGGPNYFVRSSLQSVCPSNVSAQQRCMTLDAYAKNTSQFLGRDVRLIFLGGVHILSREFNLSRVENVRLVAANTMREFFNHSNARIEVVNADMIFDSVGSLSMENLTITGATIVLDNTPKRSADIRGVKFLKTSLLQRYHAEVIAPEPEPEGGGDPDEPPDGGPDDNNMVDDFQYSNTSLHPEHMNIRIENSILEHSGRTGLQIVDERLHGDLKIDIQNTSVSHHMQGGIIIESTTKLHFTITDSVIEGNMVSAGGGRKNIYSAAAGLGIYSNRPDGARVTIRGTRFTNNRDFRGMPMVMWVSRAHKVEVENSDFLDNLGTAIRAANIKDTLRFRGNVTFRNNMARNGGALALVSTIIDIMPESNVTFEGNHANNVGGAIFVQSTSTMYEENNPNTLVPCFYRFPEINREINRDDGGDIDNDNNNMYTLRNLTFGNNSAFGGGHGIYGASLRSYCLVDKVGGPKHETPIRSGDQLARAGFLFNETTDEHMSSLVSSQPSRVCILNDKNSKKSFSESCATASQIFVKLSAYPGEEFSLKAVLVGAEFGTGTGEVFAQFLPVHESEPRLLSQHQSSQKVRGHLNFPKTLTYSVFSRNSYEILVLTTNPDPVSSYGDEEQMLDDIENYNYSSIIPIGLLTTPIYINVTLSKCPSGFFLDSDSMGCKCNPQVCNEAEGGEKATERGGLLYFGERLWVNAYDDGQVNGIILHYNCPYDYCKSSSNGIDLSNPDTQCAMDHAGILCGKCEPGYSMALGTDKCLPCSDNNISLLLFFGLAGFLLVFVLHIFNITVTQGTLSGLLFYANIMWAYRSIFFAHHENWFLKTFVAWLNLDFGIEACFSRGLTAYGKTWMQYMFPLYVWMIAGGVMLFSYSAEKLAKHYGGKRSVQILVKIANFFGNNSLQVMATLFILSYAKLLRTSIIALVPAHLYVYTDSGERIDALTTTVWSYDGNLVYGHLPHIFLLLVALAVIVFLLVPYTALLLFVQPIKMAATRCRCFKWINKIRPFFDAYTGPLNPLTQFWVGLLLLARFVLLLTFIVTYASDPSVSLVAMVITVVLLLVILTCTGPLYNDPLKTYVRFPDVISFQSIMEVAFLLNLVIVGVSTLSVDFVTGDVHTKASILYISVIIAFFQFALILLYHLWTILMKRTCSGSDASTSGGFIKTKRGGYQNLEAENAAGFWPTVSNKQISATEAGEEDKLQKSKLEAINGDDNASSSTLVTSSSKVANGGKSIEYSTTSCDASELSKPVFAESTTTVDKEPPLSYDSSEVCKSKLTDSIVKKDLLASLTTSSSSERDLRKPMLTDSGSDKDQHSSYDSLELCKPLLTDSNLA